MRRSTNPLYFVAFVLVAAALCIGLPLGLAGCSTVSSLTNPVAGSSTSASSSTADPVALLKATGATPDPGTVTGSHDVYGDRYASGTFPGGEQVTVYTCASQAAFLAAQGRVPPPDDLHGLVTVPGSLAVITTTGVVNVTTGGSQWGGPAPAEIAAAVHGLVTGA